MLPDCRFQERTTARNPPFRPAGIAWMGQKDCKPERLRSESAQLKLIRKIEYTLEGFGNVGQECDTQDRVLCRSIAGTEDEKYANSGS